jgi:DNA-binding beta-propeller fold protein YncE
MKNHFLSALLFASGLIAIASASTAAQGVLLVSYNAEHRVALIDVRTQNVLATFASPQGPHEISISRDRSRAYIADTGTGPGGSPGDSIVVLDLKGRSSKATFKACERPHDTRVSRDGRLLWVACAPMKAVLEMDARTGAVLKTWTTGLDGGWFVEVTPDERKLYVPHLEGKALSVIDRKTGTVRTVFSGTTQFGITITPNGREVWVSDADKNQLSIIETANDLVRATISLDAAAKDQPSFSRLRFTPDGRQMVVVRGSKFIVIDPRRRSILWSIDMPYEGKVLTTSGDSRQAFVSHPDNDRVSIIDLLTRRIDSTFAVGKQPDGVAWLGASAGAQSSSREKDVQRFLEDHYRALSNSDVERFLNFYDHGPNFVEVEGGNVQNWAEHEKTARSFFAQAKNIRARWKQPPRIVLLGNSGVCVTGIDVWDFELNGQARQTTSLSSYGLVLTKDGWRIILAHRSFVRADTQ